MGLASESMGFEPGYQFALIGEQSDSVYAKISFLQCATSLTELDGYPVSEEALLGALATLQPELQNKFSKGKDEVNVEYSKEVSACELDLANVDIICQSATLSMPGPGRRMLVITKAAIENREHKVETIDQDDLNYLLDFAASTYDIENTKVGLKASATKQMNRDMLLSDVFLRGRSSIRPRTGASSTGTYSSGLSQR